MYSLPGDPGLGLARKVNASSYTDRAPASTGLGQGGRQRPQPVGEAGASDTTVEAGEALRRQRTSPSSEKASTLTLCQGGGHRHDRDGRQDLGTGAATPVDEALEAAVEAVEAGAVDRHFGAATQAARRGGVNDMCLLAALVDVRVM